MAQASRGLAIVTGASTGIGYELAKECARNGYELLIAADEPEIKKAAETLRAFDVPVTALETNLATIEGVDELYDATAGRPVEILMANAGRGLGRGFLEQKFDDIRYGID